VADTVKSLNTWVTRWFSKVGKGVPQVELVDTNSGEPIFKDEKDENGKPVKVRITGNEQYQAKQLAETIPYFKADEDGNKVPNHELFMEAALEATDGDLSILAEAATDGLNKHYRSVAGGSDKYEKAAKLLIKSGVEGFKGREVEEVATMLRTRDLASLFEE